MAENNPELEAGIAAALDEQGAVAIGWVLAVAYKRPDQQRESTGYFVDYMDGMPYHSVLGLIEVLHQRNIPTEEDE